MIKLCVFDLDGLLIDTETVYVNTAKWCCELYGYEVPEDLLYEIMGKTETAIRQMFLDRLGNDFPYDEFIEKRVSLRLPYLEKHPVQRKKGLEELFQYLEKNNIKKSLATSSEESRASFYLNQTNLIDRFDYKCFGNNIINSKPHPEIYLKAIEPFNLEKEEILAFEDSNNGILSAYNAGLKVVHIPDLAIVTKETKEKAYVTLNDLSEAIDVIKALD